MSTPLQEQPRPQTPGADDSVVPPALAQDTRGSVKDFGLNLKRLRRTRIIVFAVLAVPLLLLTLLALKFLSMPITQATHRAAYDEADYPAAIERLAPVEFANWYEPYLPHLSKGTALLQQGEDAAAEEELRIALDEWTSHSDLNSPMHAQCKIINNLSIAIERRADTIEDPQQRADALFEAEQLLAACAGGGGGGEGDGAGQGGAGNEDSETTEGNGDRVEEKRRAADEEAGNDPDARDTGGSGEEQGGTPQQQDPGDPKREDPEGDGPTEEAPTDGGSDENQKDDELEKRNRDAQGGDGEQDPGGSPQDPVKPW